MAACLKPGASGNGKGILKHCSQLARRRGRGRRRVPYGQSSCPAAALLRAAGCVLPGWTVAAQGRCRALPGWTPAGQQLERTTHTSMHGLQAADRRAQALAASEHPKLGVHPLASRNNKGYRTSHSLQSAERDPVTYHNRRALLLNCSLVVSTESHAVMLRLCLMLSADSDGKHGLNRRAFSLSELGCCKHRVQATDACRQAVQR